MAIAHASLASGRWQTMPLAEQLANVGSDVARARRWQDTDAHLCDKAFERALELLDLTIGDPRSYFYVFAVAARAELPQRANEDK